jgi:hypothetical protein
MVSDFTPQAMLFGIAIDLALLGLVTMRARRGSDYPLLLGLVLVLGFGAVCGFAQVALYSVKVRPLLVVYELVLPYAFWIWLSRLLYARNLHWAPLPFVIIVGVLAWQGGWGFQSPELLTYELVFLLLMMVAAVTWSLKGVYLEGEGLYLIGALALLLVMGPAYGLIWGDLEVHFMVFALVGAIAGGAVVAGKMMNPVLNFPITKVAGEDTHGEWDLGPGIFIVPPESMRKVQRSFENDVRRGRFGLWISTDPVAKVLGSSVAQDRDDANKFAARLTHTTFSEYALDPSDADTFRRTLAEFFRRTRDGVVLIKDGHYLMSNTDVWEVAEVLDFLKAKIGKKGATLLLEGDLLGSWERKHLESIGVKWFEKEQ